MYKKNYINRSRYKKKRECLRVTAIGNFKEIYLKSVHELYSKGSCDHAIRYTPSTRGPWCPHRTAADVCRRVAECNQSAADCRAKPRSRPITDTASTPEAEGSCRGVVPTSTYPESITRASRRRRDIPFLDPAWNQVCNQFTYRRPFSLSLLCTGISFNKNYITISLKY